MILRRYVVLSLVLSAGSISSADLHNYTLQTYGKEDTKCSEAKRVAASVLDLMPTNGEQVVLVCEDKIFDDFLKSLNGATNRNAFFLKLKTSPVYFIYIRARSMLGDTRGNFGFTAKHIIAHEYGHLVTHSDFDEVAEAWVARNGFVQ